MTELLANGLLYGPPLLCAALYYLRERKTQASARQKNLILLYLVPIALFAGVSAVWSVVMMGILSLMG